MILCPASPLEMMKPVLLMVPSRIPKEHLWETWLWWRTDHNSWNENSSLFLINYYY